MRLATRTWGSGPRRIGLVHGNAGSAELWTDFAELVAARHDATVVAVDLPGHGATGHAAGDAGGHGRGPASDADRGFPASALAGYRLAAMADDLVAALPAHLDVVVGHSLGGRVLAGAVERLAPARAIYLDPAFSLPLEGTAAGRALLRSGPIAALTAWQLGRVPGPRRVAPDLRARYARAAGAWDRRMMRGVIGDLLPALVPAPPAVPSTLLLSTAVLGRSLLVSRRQAAGLAAAGWDVRILPRSEHDLPGLHPAETAAALDDVLGAALEDVLDTPPDPAPDAAGRPDLRPPSPPSSR